MVTMDGSIVVLVAVMPLVVALLALSCRDSDGASVIHKPEAWPKGLRVLHQVVMSGIVCTMVLMLVAASDAPNLLAYAFPETFTFDCTTLTDEQQAIVRNKGLPAIGIWKRCREHRAIEWHPTRTTAD